MNLLHLDSSILGAQSVSRLISGMAVKHLTEKSKKDTDKLVYRDLAQNPIPHLTGQYLAGQSANVKHDQALQEDLKLGGSVLEEYLAADTVVIGAGLYNFGIPSQLKSWADRIMVAGKTFRYTEQGPVGLAKDKHIIIAIARGGFYGPNSPSHSFEHSANHLKSIFQFLQVKKMDIIVAEGIAVGAEQREKSIQAAKKEIETIL